MPFVPYLVSLGLLLGALLLAVTSALALAAAVRGLGPWLRWPAALVAKTLALFPLSALLWAAIGLWVGAWSLPVGSLMPAPADPASMDLMTRLAHVVWWWMPPVLLLAVPLTGELLTGRLVGKRSLREHLCLAGFLGIALLAVVEEAFHLPGALAPLIPALHGAEGAGLAPAVIPPAMLAAAWVLVMWAWPQEPETFHYDAATRIREGALVIGLSPRQAWTRHLLPGQIQRAVAALCSAVAVGTSLWTAYGCPGNADRSRDFYAAFRAALNDPGAPLQTALPFTLCALFFWLLGRIILPRPRQQ